MLSSIVCVAFVGHCVDWLADLWVIRKSKPITTRMAKKRYGSETDIDKTSKKNEKNDTKMLLFTRDHSKMQAETVFGSTLLCQFGQDSLSMASSSGDGEEGGVTTPFSASDDDVILMA